jgi:hypothetical protein
MNEKVSITEQVKSFEDACKVLGIDSVPEMLEKSGFTKDEIAYRKLKTIAKSLNEGWEPDWSNFNQYKYFPWFQYYGAYAGFACADTYNAASAASTGVGSRLCFKTRELATYAGKTFTSLYNDFLLIKD